MNCRENSVLKNVELEVDAIDTRAGRSRQRSSQFLGNRLAMDDVKENDD